MTQQEIQERNEQIALMLGIDETEGRQIVDNYKASTYDYGAWSPMTKEEYDSIKSKYKEIYGK